MAQETYYEVTYTETLEGQLINSGPYYVRSSTPISLDHLRSFVKSQLSKNPMSVFTFPLINKLDKETYLLKTGNNPIAPWYIGPGTDEK